MFRPDHPLLPNYKWMPIGYHGRATPIVPSGTPVGVRPGAAAPPENGGCRWPAVLDYELRSGSSSARGTGWAV